MTQAVAERLKAHFADKVTVPEPARGEWEVHVRRDHWHDVAQFLRDDDPCAMNQFIDLTAVDHPEREDMPRFDVVVLLRSNPSWRSVSDPHSSGGRRIVADAMQALGGG